MSYGGYDQYRGNPYGDSGQAESGYGQANPYGGHTVQGGGYGASNPYGGENVSGSCVVLCDCINLHRTS